MCRVEGITVKTGDFLYHKGSGQWVIVARSRPADGHPWTHIEGLAATTGSYSWDGPNRPKGHVRLLQKKAEEKLTQLTDTELSEVMFFICSLETPS